MYGNASADAGKWWKCDHIFGVPVFIVVHIGYTFYMHTYIAQNDRRYFTILHEFVNEKRCLRFSQGEGDGEKAASFCGDHFALVSFTRHASLRSTNRLQKLHIAYVYVCVCMSVFFDTPFRRRMHVCM